MIVTVHPSQLAGDIIAPASKSSMQRACAAALLTIGETILVNPGKSNDDMAALEVIQKLGAKVGQEENGHILISSRGVNPVNAEVNCGESGLGIRMFTPIAALSNQAITLNGTGSLLTRPMDFFDEIFPQLGISIQSNKGKLPLQIKGPLVPANITIDGSLSSQFLTGLLMAYGASGAKEVTIRVKDLASKPYIDLTLQVMQSFGWEVSNNHYQSFHFSGRHTTENTETGKEKSLPRQYTVEGDWSGGAFLLVAGAIAGPLTVKGLDIHSTQADKAVMKALKDCGAMVELSEKGIRIGPGALKAFSFNANDCPDLFPPLVALAAYCKGTSEIEGVNRLTHKESNRALTLQQEFAKLGVEISFSNDTMLVKGGEGLRGADTHSHHDHRIAMATAVAGLQGKGEVRIREAEAINKSYPDFYRHLQNLGAHITL